MYIFMCVCVCVCMCVCIALIEHALSVITVINSLELINL